MQASWLCGFGVKIMYFTFMFKAFRSVGLKLKGKMQTVENYGKTRKKQFISCFAETERGRPKTTAAN